jgi:hypothetical protein
MTVGEMLHRMTSSELAEWQVYERLYGPVGQERDDQLAALVAATIANAMSGKKGKRHKIRDFLPVWSKQKQSSREQLDVLRTLVKKMGGEEVNRGDDR